MGTVLFRTAILFLFWILLSGKLAPFHLWAGFFTALFAAWACTLHDSTKAGRATVLTRGAPRQFLRALRYMLWLLKSIILAAWHVSKIVVDPRLPIRPALIRHKTVLKKDLEKVIFANSITLTPGTITGDFDGDTLIIHRLDEPSSGDIDNGEMERQIQRIFKPKRKRR